MQITRLELKDFRNIREAAVSFCPGVNVICGENAQGKTNLLEAVALLTGRGSFRGARESQMTRFGEKAFHLKMAFRDAEREQSIAYDAGATSGRYPSTGCRSHRRRSLRGCSRRWSSTRRTSRW